MRDEDTCTRLVGILWMRDQPIAETSLTHNIHKRQSTMPPVGFEPIIPTIKWLQTYALDCMATWIS
jgi:hypothetical protein